VLTPLVPTIVVDPSRPTDVVANGRVVEPVGVPLTTVPLLVVAAPVVVAAPLVVVAGPVSPTNPPFSSSAVLPPHAASAVPPATSQDKPYFAIVQKR
jgi:hypothetical protein